MYGAAFPPLMPNSRGFPGSSDGKASAYNAGDPGSIPGSGRSPGEGNGNQYSCLENPMDWGAWWATIHGVTKSRTWLSDFTSLHFTVMPNSSRGNDTFFKRAYASMPQLPGLLYSVFLTPWQATVDSCLRRRLPNTLTQVWLSLLWDNCSFLLRAGAYRFCLCSPRVSVSPVLWKSVIKSRWHLTADSLVSLLVPHVGKFVLGPRTFSTVQELLWYNFSPVCGCIIQM